MDMIYIETDNDLRATQIVEAMHIAADIQSRPDGLIISLKDGSQCMPKLMEKIGKQNIEILNVNLKKPTLDDVFIYFTGRGLRDENGTLRVNSEDRGEGV